MRTTRSTLRFYIHRQLITTILLCSLISAAGVYVVGEVLFGYLYDRARSGAFMMENHDIHLFDLIAGSLEAKARSDGARALVELGKRYYSPASIQRATTAELLAEAERLGVGGIYLIGADGRVVTTTLDADRGLELFSLGEEFKAFLVDLVGKGKVASQSLSLSTRTGLINMYQYYSPPGSTVLIEISTSLHQLLAAAYPGVGYEAILTQLFNLAGPNGNGRLVWLTDIVTFGPGNYQPWSLLKEGSPSDIPKELLAEAIKNGKARGTSGGRETYVRIAAFDRRDVSYFNARFLEVFSSDLRPIGNYRLICLVAGLGIAALISAISWAQARRGFAVHVTKRVESIVESLRNIEVGSAEMALDSSNDDEFSAIGQGLYSMVTAIMKKNAELESLSRCLEEKVDEGAAREDRLSRLLEEKQTLIKEVHHRVRNNLQILSSLVALQALEVSDDAVLTALGAIRTRILSLSLAHDQLYESDALTSIDAYRYFSELASNIVNMHAHSDRHILVQVDSHGASISPDVAIPLGLAVGELVANACEHAFPDCQEGTIGIQIEQDADGLRVVVADDGVGMRSAPKGLGLDIVRALCEQLGGEFQLESRSPRGNSGIIAIKLV